MAPAYAPPGVRREAFAAPAPAGLRTGVPAFLGLAAAGRVNEPVELVRGADFPAHFGASPAGGCLAAAVSAFFRNGGERCHVVRLASVEGGGAPAERAALLRGLDAARALDTVDLVCAPDLMGALAAGARCRPATADEHAAAVALQGDVLEHCDRVGDRMALLDAAPGASPAEVLAQRELLWGTNGALYYPWLLAEGAGTAGGAALVPPCGHVAGVYARGDARAGVHKAPANEPLEGVLDLERLLDDADQRELNPCGVNCIRAFPGRGVRVWGARTLSRDGAWRHVGVRRVFLTVGRWIERNLAAAAFEPSTPLLWARIGREVGAYLAELFRRGALQGRTPAEAFYVHCDASVNPRDVREAGVVVIEIGLAPVVPNEFVVVRFTHGPGGVDLAGPGPAA
jgi:hypothetical protein